MNIEAERQLEQIEKEKARQLREGGGVASHGVRSQTATGGG